MAMVKKTFGIFKSCFFPYSALWLDNLKLLKNNYFVMEEREVCAFKPKQFGTLEDEEKQLKIISLFTS